MINVLASMPSEEDKYYIIDDIKFDNYGKS